MTEVRLPHWKRRPDSDMRGYQVIASFDNRGNLMELETSRGDVYPIQKKNGRIRYGFDSVDLMRQSKKMKQLKEGVALLEDYLKDRWD